MKALLLFAASAGTLAAQTYEIYGIRYATIKECSVAGLVAGALGRSGQSGFRA